MKRSHGKMRSSRGLAKGHRTRGAPPVTKYLQEFAVGETVHVAIVASEHNGMPHPRYQGRTGVVLGKQGRAFKVEISDGNSKKVLIVPAVHLNKA